MADRAALMPQYLVIQVDPIPAAGEMAENIKAWRIEAAGPGEASTIVGQMVGSTEPIVTHVFRASDARRFTTAPTLNYGSSEG
jgi:hypothetical protein